MELDQLYKKLRYPHRQRLDFLEAHADVVEQRDDLCIERITLYNQLGEYQKAYDLINSRKFHPWEGGEGKVTSQYLLCRVELAKIAIREGRFADAVRLLKETEKYPDNLGEGKLSMAEENDIHYWMGCAYEGLGEEALAKEYFTKATKGSAEPAIAFFYNDQQPDKIFYQGLALLKLGLPAEANTRFDKLIAFGEKHLNETIKLDYFAVSLPDLLIWEDDLTYRNKIHCHYMLGLGFLGTGDTEKSKFHLTQAAQMDVNHQGVQVHLPFK
jgi:tetratricopeptide (TPR) repeat protein